jgi:hypothetical protein
MRLSPATSFDLPYPRPTAKFTLSRILLASCFAMSAPWPAAATAADREAPRDRRSWIWSSVPPGRSASVQDHAVLQWYNPVDPLPTAVDEHDLNPALTNEEGGESQRQVLELRVEPPTGEPGLESADWTGIAVPLANEGLDFTKLVAVEIWVNDFRTDHTQTHGTLRIQMGHFDEDAFWDRDNPPNGHLDSEDKNVDGRLDRRDPNDRAAYLLEDEDTGLDGVHDEEEAGPGDSSDPNQDNYRYTPGLDFSTINNLEDNALDDPNAGPDTEDLDRDAGFDRSNDYFEIPVDLSNSRFVTVDVPVQYAGDPDVDADNGWRRFRIPVGDLGSVGLPSLATIQAARLILDGLSEPVQIQVGGIRFVGVQAPPTGKSVVLHQNRPNPFNPTTTIPYSLRESGHVRLDIFDVSGRLVRTLVDLDEADGMHYVAWNGRDQEGRPLPSGIYLYRVRKEGGEDSRMMLLLK